MKKQIHLHISILFFALVLTIIFGNMLETPSEKILEFFYGKLYKISKFDGISYDANNMPLIDYKSFKGIHIGRVYNPLVVGWKTNEIIDKKIITRKDTLTILNFADNLVLQDYGFEENTGLLKHNYGWPRCNIIDYYYSCLSQGRALQVMLAAFKLSGDSIYLANGKRLVMGFFIDIENDGLREVLDDSSWWYEEYASKSVPVPFVLNGMISSVLCLNEFYSVTGDTNAWILSKNGFNAIVKKLPQFDRNGYAFYDLLGNVCTPLYEKYTISLLKDLQRIKVDSTLDFYQTKWEEYQNNTIFIKKVLDQRSRRSLGMIAVQFISVFAIVELFGMLFFYIFYKRRKRI